MFGFKYQACTLALAFGLFVAGSDASVFAQQKTARDFSDSELRSFAKAYVQFHRIKDDYEARINRTQDARERQRLQTEGDAKVNDVLRKQGFTTDSYKKTFAAVNNNEQLRRKTLKYVEEERKGSS